MVLTLKQGLEHQIRSGRGNAGEFDVLHDADDFDLVARFRVLGSAPQKDAPADGVLIRKEAACRALGKYRDFGRMLVVAAGVVTFGPLLEES